MPTVRIASAVQVAAIIVVSAVVRPWAGGVVAEWATDKLSNTGLGDRLRTIIVVVS
jgi:hypothetical protein